MKKGKFILDKVKSIKLLVLDVDGVMTDGRLYFDAHGESMKVFHVHDGYGIKSLIAAGMTVAIISSRTSIMVEKRARELGIHYVIQGQINKLLAYRSLLSKVNILDEQVSYMGDDLPDAELMKIVGLSFAPADAHPSILKIAAIVTKLPGGKGAVREACDILLDNYCLYD